MLSKLLMGLGVAFMFLVGFHTVRYINKPDETIYRAQCYSETGPTFNMVYKGKLFSEPAGVYSSDRVIRYWPGMGEFCVVEKYTGPDPFTQPTAPGRKPTAPEPVPNGYLQAN